MSQRSPRDTEIVGHYLNRCNCCAWKWEQIRTKLKWQAGRYVDDVHVQIQC